MKVVECTYRDLLYKVVYVETNLNSMIKDEFENDENTSGYIAYAYVDHNAGFTFEVLACASKKDAQWHIYKENNMVSCKERISRVFNTDSESDVDINSDSTSEVL